MNTDGAAVGVCLFCFEVPATWRSPKGLMLCAECAQPLIDLYEGKFEMDQEPQVTDDVENLIDMMREAVRIEAEKLGAKIARATVAGEVDPADLYTKLLRYKRFDEESAFLAKQWQAILHGADMPLRTSIKEAIATVKGHEKQRAKVVRRAARVRGEDVTSMDSVKRAVLHALYELGGQDTAYNLSEYIQEKRLIKFMSSDMDLMGSGQTRWRQRVSQSLQEMRQDGRVTRPGGTQEWRLTLEGRESMAGMRAVESENAIESPLPIEEDQLTVLAR